MKISDLVALAENKLANLNNEMATAAQLGDTDAVDLLDSKIYETEQTLEKLRAIN